LLICRSGVLDKAITTASGSTEADSDVVPAISPVSSREGGPKSWLIYVQFWTQCLFYTVNSTTRAYTGSEHGFFVNFVSCFSIADYSGKAKEAAAVGERPT
jgi:hypothetical protein